MGIGVGVAAGMDVGVAVAFGVAFGVAVGLGVGVAATRSRFAPCAEAPKLIARKPQMAAMRNNAFIRSVFIVISVNCMKKQGNLEARPETTDHIPDTGRPYQPRHSLQRANFIIS
jgi:hypothetical protein